jgi:hypothetical protein
MLQTTQGAEILRGLGAISDWVKSWAVPLAAIGTVSMALLQVAKNTLPLRSVFQKSRLLGWLAGRDVEAAPIAAADLIDLAAAGDDVAFYNSDIDDVCAQIKGVVPVILDYPEKHRALLLCLASDARRADIEILLKPPPADLFGKPAGQSTAAEKELVRRYAAAKTRVGVDVRCAIDAIDAHIGFRWKRLLQVLSLLLSGVLGLAAVLAGVAGTKADRASTIGAALIVGLLSGFLAPVARDLVAAVEKWRS